jgi:hypothetical protein|tara:strand:+ start:494 stop:664 length:171 start_codon:yes stop_codon:yes gene_type:complete
VSTKVFTEVVCDSCGTAEPLSGNIPKYALTDYGWIVSQGLTFCNEKCKEKFNGRPK